MNDLIFALRCGYSRCVKMRIPQKPIFQIQGCNYQICSISGIVLSHVTLNLQTARKRESNVDFSKTVSRRRDEIEVR